MTETMERLLRGERASLERRLMAIDLLLGEEPETVLEDPKEQEARFVPLERPRGNGNGDSKTTSYTTAAVALRALAYGPKTVNELVENWDFSPVGTDGVRSCLNRMLKRGEITRKRNQIDLWEYSLNQQHGKDT